MKYLFWGARSALWVVWLVCTLVPYSLMALVVSVFLRGAPLYGFCRGWMWLAIQGARLICGVRWRLQGLANLPTGSAILVSKHQSAWETLAYTVLMPVPLTFVFKRELLLIPFFGWAIARLDMIHIDRRRGSVAWHKVAAQGRHFLARGNWVIMFPEGTRTPRGGQGVYRAGAARLSLDTGVPMVPMAVTSARCWPRRSFVLRPGVIDVSIGQPIAGAAGQERNAGELMHKVEHWIEAEMQRLDPLAYEGRAGESAACPPAGPDAVAAPGSATSAPAPTGP